MNTATTASSASSEAVSEDHSPIRVQCKWPSIAIMGQAQSSKSQMGQPSGTRTPPAGPTAPNALATRPTTAKPGKVVPSQATQPQLRHIRTAIAPPGASTYIAVPAPPTRSICTAVPAPPTRSICTAVPAPPTKSICTAIPTPPSPSTTSSSVSSGGSGTIRSTPTLIPSIPLERERNFKRKKGFEYLLVTIEFQKGKKFGLGMVHTENRVLVNQVDDNSMCTNVMKCFDRICDVEGVPVTDKELCKKQIVKGLKKDHKVSLAVERPITKDRMTQVQNLLNMMKDQPPSVVLELDVKEILARYNQRLKGGTVKKQVCGHTFYRFFLGQRG
ncbi:hypothetical protein OESDEN_21219 [Oesophagostomum dentatum]|uniref:PDZ domain-containing protein n=1 Tax=Oesophagostomum dentatum TaxID=61180 RepID=A0A0B1S1E9_OESDE|nr:hypothetical protein OESDEN_21219 [Oesophagostomum dentatum]